MHLQTGSWCLTNPKIAHISQLIKYKIITDKHTDNKTNRQDESNKAQL